MDQKVDQEDKAGVVDHLTSPRKKRRNFAVMAISSSFDKDLLDSIESYIRINYQYLTLVRPKSKEELRVLLSKNITVMFIDDTFLWREGVFQELKLVKQRKGTKIPFLFLTDDEERLIDDYNKELLAFQEIDSYVNFRKLPMEQLLARVGRCISANNKRASRRYQVEIPVRYFHLTDDKQYNGHIVDISIHGAILLDASGVIFRQNEQLKINIPINNLIDFEGGEFLRVSAKVRRVMISGNRVGISWEYLSDSQLYYITNYVIAIVNNKISKANLKNKNKAALIAAKGT